MDDALVEKVARAIQPVLEQDSEIYWASEYGRPTPEASLAALARAAITAADNLRLAGVKEGLEMAAARFEQAIADGYNAPKDKTTQCEHGQFGWEDCIACYDDALIAAVSDARSLGPRP